MFVQYNKFLHELRVNLNQVEESFSLYNIAKQEGATNMEHKQQDFSEPELQENSGAEETDTEIKIDYITDSEMAISLSLPQFCRPSDESNLNPKTELTPAVTPGVISPFIQKVNNRMIDAQFSRYSHQYD